MPGRPDRGEPSRLRLTVTAGEARSRLDRVLSDRYPDRSRSYLQKLIRDGHVTISGEASPLKPGRLLSEGETVEVVIPAPRPLDLEPEPVQLSILHEDDRLIVLNKAPGMVVHPGAGVSRGTLVHALLHHCRDLSGIGGVERPGIVHRLDKETSGVLVAAKDDVAHRDLARQFQDRTVEKVYLALVWGAPGRPEGTIDVPIGRDVTKRVRISARTGRPREALTRYRVLDRPGGFSWLEVAPRTGRTHQIRVHLKLIGHPIVGDAAYGGARWSREPDPKVRARLARFGRLALHARRLAFRHPGTEERLAFEAPVPGDLLDLIEDLKG